MKLTREERLGEIHGLTGFGYASLALANLPIIIDNIRSNLGGHVSLDRIREDTLFGFIALAIGTVCLALRDRLKKQLPPETLE